MKEDRKVLIITSSQTTVSSSIAQVLSDPERSILNITRKFISVSTLVALDTLKQNMKGFLENLGTIISTSPQKMGQLSLDEIEISAQIDAKGNIGFVEAGIQSGIKFILRKKAQKELLCKTNKFCNRG